MARSEKRAPDHAAKRAPDHAAKRAPDHAAKRAPDHAAKRAPAHLLKRSGRPSWSTAAAPRDEAIFGIHAVAEALAAGERLKRIMIGKARERDPALGVILENARAAGVQVSFEDEAAFRRFGDARHQHVAAIAPLYAYADWASIREVVRADPSALVVALDHVEDPQNLGSVLRNAEGAGAAAVVIPDRRSAAVTAATRRAAAGAASHLRVASVPNLVRALDDLKSDGCWVYGLAAAEGAVSYTDLDFSGRCVLVVGAEGKGLSRLVSEHCDRLAVIPLRGKVASLNAASASAVALFEAVRQKTQRRSVAPEHTRHTPVNP
jgi:23S rRNA (guanosine2251-2'-O)-methyltransferase